MSNRTAYAWTGVVACAALVAGILNGGRPTVNELSRVERERGNTLVVTLRGPVTENAVRVFAAAEQAQHGLVRVYVYAEGVSPGSGEAEALYERRPDGAFERRY